MRPYIYLFFILCMALACNRHPQQQTSGKTPNRRHASADTLLQELAKASEDTSKVNLLNDLSFAYLKIDLNKAIQYGREALTLAEKLKWEIGMAQSHQQTGIGYMARSEFPNAKKHLEQALKIYQSQENKTGTAATLLNFGEVYYGQADYPKALEYEFKALKIFEELLDSNGKAKTLGKIGMSYFYLYEPKSLDYLNKALEMNTALDNKSDIAENLRFIGNQYTQRLANPKKGLEYYLKSLKIEEELGDITRIARNRINIGIAYGALHDHVRELDYKYSGLKMYKELGIKGGIANAYGNIGWSYFYIGADSNIRTQSQPVFAQYHIQNKRHALLLSQAYMDSAGKIFIEIGEPDHETYFVISQVDSILGNYKEAYINYRKSIGTKELMFSREKTSNVAQMQMQYDYDKKEIVAKAEQERKQIVQRNIRNTIIGGLIAALIVIVVVTKQRNNTRREKKRSDNLLLNILPEEVAEELKATGSAEARQFDEVTVLFTDFKDFTQISETMTAAELVAELNTFFRAFDEIIIRFGIEKIKTIGDSYMCVGGLPSPSATHAEDVVNAGLAIQAFVAQHSEQRIAEGKLPLHIRIGIHSGPVVAGIVGIKKYAYDIWGDTVNTASRMESSGEAGKVNISEATYQLVKDKFRCTPRGKIAAKHKGEIDMYFVEGRI